MERLYLDANGSCPPCPEAQQKIIELAGLIGNPSSFHEEGRRLRSLIDDAREHVAQALGCKSRDVIFGSGASEANRLFVDAVMLKARQECRIPKVIMSPFEHPSLLKSVLGVADQQLISLELLEIDKNGAFIDLEKIKYADILICCEAHNETGIMPDFDELLRNTNPSTLVMSDISQSFARKNTFCHERIDVMTFSAQKMGGFAGSGGIVMRGLAKNLKAPWQGGGQERGFRPGTESALLIAAFGEASRVIKRTRMQNLALEPLRNYFETELKSLECHIIGQSQKRLSNTSAISFAHPYPDALRIACDMAGLSVGFGSACSGLAPEGSFALKRMGIDTEQQKATIRFSFAPHTTKDVIDEALWRIKSNILKPKES
ncbi:MAG: aminotransferase class V-fold PLP-dependent enzyme [Myxococcales bacterium]|nr:aminotransferase class V-fold PLP-dependent enzyme [Myxococcales bacterium]USN51719.1 MAG: aminotransferase class V-fold PLP-dependent enzyme [Myxococcales bacterium]